MESFRRDILIYNAVLIQLMVMSFSGTVVQLITGIQERVCLFKKFILLKLLV